MVFIWHHHHTITLFIQLTVCCVSSCGFDPVSSTDVAAATIVEIAGSTDFQKNNVIKLENIDIDFFLIQTINFYQNRTSDQHICHYCSFELLLIV